jgi:hypothetical protein
VLPIPEDVYHPYGIDSYLCPLIGLFGECTFLQEIGAAYRLHGDNQNWYDRPAMKLDLPAIRKELRFMHTAGVTIERFARELDLPREREILSVLSVASRLISLRLDREGHPYPFDNRLQLMLDGFTAASRRFDIRWPMKMLFAAWFVLMAVSPRPFANWLAETFYFPEKRRTFNGLLSLMHARTPASPPVANWRARSDVGRTRLIAS